MMRGVRSAPFVASLERLGRLASLASVVGLVGCADCNKPGGAGADGGTGTPGPSASSSVAAPRSSVPMNATPVPTASVNAAMNPDNLPAYSGPTGSVEGTVFVTGDPARATPADFGKCADAEKTWGKVFREGPVGPDGKRLLGDAIVAITGYKGFYIPEQREAKQITIQGCAYTTRTATMTYGQRLEVKNESSEFWTPMLEPGTNMVLMMATPKGDPVKIYPKKPGHYLLMDRDRKYAYVDVYAFLYPLHTSTDLAGHFRIDGVPVGKMKLSTTHPQIEGADSQEVTITADVVTKQDFTLKNVNRDAGPPKDAGATDAARPPPLR